MDMGFNPINVTLTNEYRIGVCVICLRYYGVFIFMFLTCIITATDPLCIYN